MLLEFVLTPIRSQTLTDCAIHFALTWSFESLFGWIDEMSQNKTSIISRGGEIMVSNVVLLFPDIQNHTLHLTIFNYGLP